MKLHLGCGNDYKEGFWNVDIGDCKKDQEMDISRPFPLQDNSYTYVYAKHVLEHIPRESFFDVFREIHRVMAHGAVLEFCVPHAGSDNYWTDPTHTMPYTVRTMDFLIEGKQLRENGKIYGAEYSFEEVEAPKVDGVYTVYFKLRKVK
tara:strand:- start:2197 stop:2640 length:444 start_codon:yes stop_codon:yes gene_type:complete